MSGATEIVVVPQITPEHRIASMLPGIECGFVRISYARILCENRVSQSSLHTTDRLEIQNWKSGRNLIIVQIETNRQTEALDRLASLSLSQALSSVRASTNNHQD